MESRSGSPFAPVLALITGLAGIALLVLAALRIPALFDDDSSDAVSVAETTTTLQTETTVVDVPIGDTTQATRASDQFLSEVTDDSGRLSFSVPPEWSELQGSPWVVGDQEVGLALGASTDLESWYTAWGTPGVFVGVSTTDHRPEIGDWSSVCVQGNTAPRTIGALSGSVQAWSSCGDEGGDFHVFVGGTADAPDTVLIQLVSTDGDGLGHLDRIMATFSVQ